MHHHRVKQTTHNKRINVILMSSACSKDNGEKEREKRGWPGTKFICSVPSYIYSLKREASMCIIGQFSPGVKLVQLEIIALFAARERTFSAWKSFLLQRAMNDFLFSFFFIPNYIWENGALSPRILSSCYVLIFGTIIDTLNGCKWLCTTSISPER